MDGARGRQNNQMSATKRISADITELAKPLYADTGIYYAADEQNIQKGYACVFGPKDTPYEDCPMLYEFTIPSTFPFDNPQVHFRTYDGRTRFHPNMYIEGKCCLSILGTWQGPKWASTMRLSTILVTLQSLMDTAPIRHEPSFENARGQVVEDYSVIVEHSCIRYILERAGTPDEKQPLAFHPFQEIFKEKLPGILDRVEDRLRKRLEKGEITAQQSPYSMSGTTRYAYLLECTLKLKADLNK